MELFKNGNFLKMGEFSITWATCFLILGVVAGVIFAFKEGKRLGISKTHITDGLLIGVPVTLVASRLFGMILTPDFFGNLQFVGEKLLKIIDVQDGSMSFIAALIAMVVFIKVYYRKLKVSTFRILDVAVPSLLLAQMITRIGQSFVQRTGASNDVLLDILGNEASSSFLYAWFPDWIIDNVTVGVTTYHPLFLYEAMWCGLGFAVLLLLRKLKTGLQSGDLAGIYLVWYGFGSAVVVEAFRQNSLMIGAANFNFIFGILCMVGGVAYLVVKHLKFKQPKYYESINEVDETSLHCYVFDLDQTIINAENLILSAYGEAVSKGYNAGVYDDPQAILDGEKLRKYVKFTKDNHEILTSIYRGVHITLKEIQSQGNEIIFISKLPADAIAAKIQFHGLSGYVNRFINSNDIAKLGRQYPTCSIMVFSSDRRLLAQASRYGFKTAFSKFANPDTNGVVADKVVERFSDILFIV